METANTTESNEGKSLVVFTTVPGFMTCADVISRLREKYDGVTYDVTTAPGMMKATAARKELREARIALDKKKPEVKREALDFCAKVEADYKAIRAAVEEYENIPDTAIKAEEERKATERAEKARIAAEIEAARVAAILQVEREAAEKVQREAMAKQQAELDEQKRVQDIEAARLKEIADKEAAKLAAEREAFEAEKKAAADAHKKQLDAIAELEQERRDAEEKRNCETERIAREKQAAIDAENKRIADEAAAKQREEERQAAILAERKRLEAVAKEKAAEKARKLAEARCKDAATAFKKILDICQAKPADALAQIAIIAEGNI